MTENLIQNLLPESNTVGFYTIKSWTDSKGRLCAGTYKIMKSGPRKGTEIPCRGSLFCFRTEERRQEWMNAQIKFATERLDTENSRKMQKSEFSKDGHDFVVGDILYGTWGYEQTNVDFYQITSTTKHTVICQRIKRENVPGSEGFMCSRVRPLKDATYGDEIRFKTKVILWNKKPEFVIAHRHYIKLYCKGTDYNRESDKGTYCSWYA